MDAREADAGARARKADFGALAAGVLFLAVAGLFLRAALTDTEPPPFGYLAPAFVTAFSLVLLVRLLFRGRRRR